MIQCQAVCRTKTAAKLHLQLEISPFNIWKMMVIFFLFIKNVLARNIRDLIFQPRVFTLVRAIPVPSVSWLFPTFPSSWALDRAVWKSKAGRGCWRKVEAGLDFIHSMWLSRLRWTMLQLSLSEQRYGLLTIMTVLGRISTQGAPCVKDFPACFPLPNSLFPPHFEFHCTFPFEVPKRTYRFYKVNLW